MNKLKRQEHRKRYQGVRDLILPSKLGNASGGKVIGSTRSCTGHSQSVAERSPRLPTKRARIQQRSANDPAMVFKQLMHHFSERNLRQWFHELSGKAATGIDGVNKADYNENLQENLKSLHQRLKRMGYHPTPVRQIWIPKEGQSKKLRPLGIGNFEGKIVEKGIQQILEAIYEPLFHDQSYGFRHGRSCHDAIRDLRSYLHKISGSEQKYQGQNTVVANIREICVLTRFYVSFDSTENNPQSTGAISPALNRIIPCEIKTRRNHHGSL